MTTITHRNKRKRNKNKSLSNKRKGSLKDSEKYQLNLANKSNKKNEAIHLSSTN
jgi:hypothetical protein